MQTVTMNEEFRLIKSSRQGENVHSGMIGKTQHVRSVSCPSQSTVRTTGQSIVLSVNCPGQSVVRSVKYPVSHVSGQSSVRSVNCPSQSTDRAPFSP